MRPIRLIALDLDGTLLRSDKTVSPYARSVLERLRSQGIRLVYATARPPRGVACLRLPAADGLVCHNGVLVYRDGRLESRQGLPAGVLGPLLRAFLAAQPGAHLALELGGELYANFNARELWPDSDFLPSTLLDLPPLEADKLLLDLGGGQAPLRWLEAHLPEGCYLQISEGRVAMLLNRQATKLQGGAPAPARLRPGPAGNGRLRGRPQRSGAAVRLRPGGGHGRRLGAGQGGGHGGLRPLRRRRRRPLPGRALPRPGPLVPASASLHRRGGDVLDGVAVSYTHLTLPTILLV